MLRGRRRRRRPGRSTTTSPTGQIGHGILNYLVVFFAIWWPWMNFTWFASAYDTDDVQYRLLTFVQIAGVLVVAAGVPAAFERQDFTVMVVGYVIMRIALVAQWLRAAREDPVGRAGRSAVRDGHRAHPGRLGRAPADRLVGGRLPDVPRARRPRARRAGLGRASRPAHAVARRPHRRSATACSRSSSWANACWRR